MKVDLKFSIVWGVLCTFTLGMGCAVEPRPIVHTVPYQSGVVCVPSGQDCPWNRLEEEARFSALVHCLMAGATVIEREQSEIPYSDMIPVLAPTPPRYGYEHRTVEGDGRQCQVTEQQCTIRNKDEGKLTWAGCSEESMDKSELKGGDTILQADFLNESMVVTGNLTTATNQVSVDQGMEGPDHFYAIKLPGALSLEAAVVSNSSKWTPSRGHQAAWQPALALLDAGGRKIVEGKVWRAGITTIPPISLAAGLYYLVIDSSEQEIQRGNGIYRLYLGYNRWQGRQILTP